jgi:hypothetical protein
MTLINILFDRMDAWRHLPNYQLERRADLFFSLYLAESLQAKLGFPIQEQFVPEFPVRIGTIFPGISSDKSYKIDYLALSADGDKALLVELKTENLSRREDQDNYLIAARNAGLPALLGGILEIFRATNAKRKYFCLLEQLEKIGLLRIPTEMHALMARPSLHGATEASRAIEITAQTTESIIVYIQPNCAGQGVISFAEFAEIVRRHEDPVSQRFATSLVEWANIRAGEKFDGSSGFHVVDKTDGCKRALESTQTPVANALRRLPRANHANVNHLRSERSSSILAPNRTCSSGEAARNF